MIDSVQHPSACSGRASWGAAGTRTGTPALPFCYISLRAPKPLDPLYPTAPVSLGEHLRKRRMDLGITQKEAARRIGADQWTVINWEKGRTCPEVRFVPGIIRFLGYDPFPRGEVLYDRNRLALPQDPNSA